MLLRAGGKPTSSVAQDASLLPPLDAPSVRGAELGPDDEESLSPEGGVCTVTEPLFLFTVTVTGPTARTGRCI